VTETKNVRTKIVNEVISKLVECKNQTYW